MASLSRFNCASLAMLFKLFDDVDDDDDELARLDTNLFKRFDEGNLVLLLANKELDEDEFDWSFIEFGDVVALLFVSDEADDVFVESVWFVVLFNNER